MARDDPSGHKQALVIVPTYNEHDTIAELTRRLFEACADVVDLLVVDDASPDGTAHLVRALGRGRRDVFLLERGEKLGLGTAYVEGFRWGIERAYPALVEIDADLSHDPKDVPRLLQALVQADLVIGSRYIEGGRIERWGPLRRLLSWGGNLYARALLGYPVKDYTSGFRAYRAPALKALDLHGIRSEGYAFQIEMTRAISRSGGRIVEIPIAFTDRKLGRSKISRRIAFEALWRVALWGIRDRLEPPRARTPKRRGGR